MPANSGKSPGTLGSSFFEGRAFYIWAFTAIVQRRNKNQKVTVELKILTSASSQLHRLALLLLPAISWAGSSEDTDAGFTWERSVRLSSRT